MLTNTNGESLGRTAGFTRDAKQRPPLSGHKFDVSKIVQYTGECSLGDAHEYWLRPGSWTKQVRNLMLNCTIPAQFWTHFAPMCCAPTVVVPWETKFERPSNAGPGWQSSLQLEMQDDGWHVPCARRHPWPAFVRWLTATFNVHALFELQHDKFKRLTQKPGESVHAYNVRWNLERELLDELALAEVYPAGSIHEVELENMYIRSLAGSFESKVLDLRAMGGTLGPVFHGDMRDSASDGTIPLGLERFQQHAVKLDNELSTLSQPGSLTKLGNARRERKRERNN